MLDQTRDTIGAAIGRIPSGCAILSVEHEGRSTGLLVSWVQQAAFEPPSLTVCIKQGRPAASLVDAAKRFLLNVIGENATPMFKHFARGFALHEDAFAGLKTLPTQFGPLLTDCIAHLACRVQTKVTAGDHDVYIVEVVAAEVIEGKKPYTHIRKSGLTY